MKSTKIDSYKYSQLNFDKGIKKWNGTMTVFNNGSGATEHSHEKKKKIHFFYPSKKLTENS